MSGRWALRGVLLPDGERPERIWVADGRISRTPLPDCEPVEGGYLCPGLVDGHAHVSWNEEDPTGPARRALVAERREIFARQGTLLVRDMGAADGLLLGEALSGDGRARVLPTGRMALRYEGYPFPHTPPEELEAAFAALAAAGAPWIKVFADWTDDFGGLMNPGFTGEDEVSYPAEVLARAVAAAHAGGARVAAHAFSRAGAACAVAARVDSIEHGWGLDAPLLDEMAREGIAWLPLLVIARGMRWGARNAGEHERVAWIEERLTAMGTTLPYAARVGVPVLAGTDWGPGLTAAQEVIALHERGLSPARALAAGTTAARAFFGAGTLEHGDSADLLVFTEDPREDLSRLMAPAAILMEGRRVPPEPPPLPPPPG